MHKTQPHPHIMQPVQPHDQHYYPPQTSYYYPPAPIHYQGQQMAAYHSSKDTVTRHMAVIISISCMALALILFSMKPGASTPSATVQAAATAPSSYTVHNVTTNNYHYAAPQTNNNSMDSTLDAMRSYFRSAEQNIAHPPAQAAAPTSQETNYVTNNVTNVHTEQHVNYSNSYKGSYKYGAPPHGNIRQNSQLTNSLNVNVGQQPSQAASRAQNHNDLMAQTNSTYASQFK